MKSPNSISESAAKTSCGVIVFFCVSSFALGRKKEPSRQRTLLSFFIFCKHAGVGSINSLRGKVRDEYCSGFGYRE